MDSMKNAKEKLEDSKEKLQQLKDGTARCLDEIKEQTEALGSEIKEIKAGFEKAGGKDKAADSQETAAKSEKQSRQG